MAGTPISIRLDPHTAKALQEAALAAGRPVATFAAHLIKEGLSSGTGEEQEGDHPLIQEVFEVFEGHEVFDESWQREAAMVLAYVAAKGGQSAVDAIRELRVILADIPAPAVDPMDTP